jgi:DNA-3-methyladenine glycosylase I
MNWSRDDAPEKPATLAGYLEAMSRPVFLTGMSWRVVQAKWEGIRDAFEEFDPQRVAAMGDDDVERLVGDARIIRNRKKIEAIIDNAARMIALDEEHGSFGDYLDSLGPYDRTVAALRRDFRFLGESGAFIFLWSVGADVPSHEEWSKAHQRRAA